jgi:hypothetical protein|tara:strand:- start:2951 stop:3796 length:846 start_codon:yes stop_codon:yes gene_type:complete
MIEDHVKSIRKHMRAAVEAAEVILYPYPHFQVENIWPKQVYDGFHQFNPLEKRKGLTKPWLEKFSDSNPQYKIRKQLDLYDLIDVNIPNAPDIQFWKIINTVLFEDNWYIKLISTKLPQYFAVLFGPQFNSSNDWAPKMTQDWFVQKHGLDYFIGPHTDRHDRVFTNIFSLPKEEGYDHLGTSLWTAKPGDYSEGGRHYTFENFTKHAQMKYIPNQLFVFFKSRWGFHAVEKFNDIDSTSRYGMQIQVYEPGHSYREIDENTEGYKVMLDGNTPIGKKGKN